MDPILINTWAGTTAGPRSKFQAVSQLRVTDENDYGKFFQIRHYVEVISGGYAGWAPNTRVSWTDARYDLAGIGIYGDSGWVDVGWIPFGQEVDYSASAEYTGGSGTVYRSELTGSYYLPLPVFTVYFNANGGSGAPDALRKTYGVGLALPSTRPSRTGFVFKGWARTSTGSAVYQPGSNFTENANVTLYAEWERIKYTIKFNANGGSGAPADQVKQYGITLKLPQTMPSRNGFKFLGWAKTSSGSAAYQPGSSFAENANVTLYAVWKRETNCYIRQNGAYVPAMMYVRRDGTYQTGNVMARREGTYRESKM